MNPLAAIFVPDDLPLAEALARCTHLGIGAHADDLEFMAFHGIKECFHRADQWFAGVVCTDGRGSVHAGPHASLSPDELGAIRRREQEAAAALGEYAAIIQLGYPSAGAQSLDPALIDDLVEILERTRPRIVYTHNPVDKHPTHVAVFAATLQALRRLPHASRPSRLLGCEVWRDLDWLPDAEKVSLDVGGEDALASALNGCFDSQIAGGKRYDLAVLGRRHANATFSDPHLADGAEMITLAMDLTPLVEDDTLAPAAFLLSAIDRFRAEAEAQLHKYFSPHGNHHPTHR